MKIDLVKAILITTALIASSLAAAGAPAPRPLRRQ